MSGLFSYFKLQEVTKFCGSRGKPWMSKMCRTLFLYELQFNFNSLGCYDLGNM